MTPFRLALFALLSIGLATGSAREADKSRDLTFYLVSDVHVGMAYKDTVPPFTAADYEEHVASTLDVLATIPGRPWPASGPLAEAMRGLGPVPPPKGLIVAGDLTESGSRAQWTDFDRLFPWRGQPPKRFPVFACAGNHDGGSKSGAVRNGLRARNQEMLKAGVLTRLSDDGLHSAWVWQGVHFINVNLYPGDTPKAGTKPGSMRDPEKSLSFLRTYLATTAPPSTPVVIVQHFDLGSAAWWDQERRKAFYEVIKDANVIAILHGHTHGITHRLFPDDPDYQAFGGGGPRFDCFSAGAFKVDAKRGSPYPGPRHPCECYVFRLTATRFTAAHFIGDEAGWNPGRPQDSLTVVKPLSLPMTVPQR